jgi:endo-beta-N-acetylglucosaminidase D
MRRRLIAIFIVVVLMASFIPMPAAQGLARENEPLLRQETLQPLGTQFEIDGILSWTPESDPDARYNRSNVPLAQRAQGHVVNPFPNPNARMVLSGDAYPIGGTMSHSYGTDGAWRRYALNFWQYVDVYNFWGGPINIPTPELMDMAHRNGVPVVGTVFFENRPVGGSERRMYYNQPQIRITPMATSFGKLQSSTALTAGSLTLNQQAQTPQ